ncbi:cupredoxin domain-containing protein [Sphaerisporangium corydalis]|uniref:EfeO-type cupredoxin-like domain-containing protein n=1 Tax=Sphaerisporangium corydalis TaxID=1441875 RepID=A0ABV9ERL4_9ACTN|nr:hypothetical protein [Sphaerisporangium corydalis]
MTSAPARRRSFFAALVFGVVLLMATACGTSSASAPGAAGVKDIAVTITGRDVSPPPGRVEVAKGQTVRITVTGDVADVTHVHGYDKKVNLLPHLPVKIEFVADQTGLFEVETHGTGLQLCQLLVR